MITVTIGWADGVFARITCTHAIDPPSGDCCANITRPNEGSATIGLTATAGVPCDFALVALGWGADMIVTAHCGLPPPSNDFNCTDFNCTDFA